MTKTITEQIRARSLILILLICQTIQLFSQVRVERQLSVYSSCLNRKVNYSLIVPQNYYKNMETYPVIYLLHGYGGDNKSWLDRCNINSLIDSLLFTKQADDYIYILPDVGNSYYINNFDSSFRYEDFFVDELVPYVDSVYRTKACKEGRILMGLSMGGFGSVILGVKHSELFGSVVAMSAAIRDPETFKSLQQNSYETLFASVYGPGLTGDARITNHWKEYSPYFLIDSTRAEAMKSIHWYIDCGMGDPLLPANEAFHDLLMQYSIPHEFHMRPGNHNWVFWYRSFIYGLNFLKGVGYTECKDLAK